MLMMSSQHAAHLENVSQTLKDDGLRIRNKQCSFMQSSVELLEHIGDKYGVHVDGQKV